MESNDLVLIRHGQSSFNRTFYDFIQARGMDPATTIWEDCFKLQGFREAVCYIERNIDAPLSPEGVEQCRQTRQQLKNQQIDIVLVSPYQRALETCNQIFGGREVKVEVHPILAEVFRYVCDIGHHMTQKREKFKHFNFEHMQDADQLWFINHLQSHHQQTIQTHLEKQPELSFQKKQGQVLTLLKDKLIYETAAELRQRIAKLKQLLLKYRQDHKKVAIVSHYYIVRTLLAEEFMQSGEIVNPKIIKNAEPYFCSIDHITKFK